MASQPDPTLIVISGNISQSGSTTTVTIRSDKYGQLSLATPVSIGSGTLNVSLTTGTGFPTVGETFDIIKATNITGDFSTFTPSPLRFSHAIVTITGGKAYRLTFTG